jgi:hypothetical protein
VLVPLRDEQIRDEVPAQHEKDIYPEKSARKHGQLFMKGDNGDNGERPDPIEARQPRCRRFDRRAVTGLFCHHCAVPPG